MAHVYIWSGAAGAGTGADWTNAYTTAAAAFTAKAAADNFWGAHDHAETAASAKTLNSPGTAASPCTFQCVNRLGSVPPVAADYRTTATITTTGASDIFINGYLDVQGVTFSAGSGANDALIRFGWDGAAFAIRFKSCLVTMPRTNGIYQAVRIGVGASGAEQFLHFDNTPVNFGSTNDGIRADNAKFLWTNTPTALPGSAPDALFYNTSGEIVCRGVDLSAVGSGKTLLTGCIDGTVTIDSCKLGGSVTVPPASYNNFKGGKVYIINSDSGATNYRNEEWGWNGSQITETTIVRTGGATDGTTPTATKIVTTADAKWLKPYESMPLYVWCDTIGTVTVTVYGIWGGGAVPNNDDIWIEVAYLGSAASPIATIDRSNGKADLLSSATAQGTDAVSTWGGSTTKFKMAVTITTAQKGPIYIYPKAGAASGTFYLDTEPELS